MRITADGAEDRAGRQAASDPTLDSPHAYTKGAGNRFLAQQPVLGPRDPRTLGHRAVLTGPNIPPVESVDPTHTDRFDLSFTDLPSDRIRAEPEVTRNFLYRQHFFLTASLSKST